MDNSPTAFNDGHFDLYILYVIMPEMSGFELLKQLITLHPTTKAIFLSGYFNPDEVDDLVKKHIKD